MSRDVVIDWSTTKPTRDEIETLLRDYMGALGKVEWHEPGQRFLVTIPGTPSYARVHVGLATDWQRAAWKGKMEEPSPKRWSPETRWFEVWSDEDVTYVMTRDADELTNGIADTFAEVLRIAWQGKIQPD